MLRVDVQLRSVSGHGAPRARRCLAAIAAAAACVAIAQPLPARVALGPGAIVNMTAPRAGNAAAATPRGDLRGNFDARCDRCHRFEPALTHPVLIVPSMPVPASLPLERGRMTCLTCHSDNAARPHGSASRGAAARDMMLRGGSFDSDPTGSPGALCAQCHAPTDVTPHGRPDRPAAGVHAASMSRAHLQRRHGFDDDELQRSLRIGLGSREVHLDPESVGCIGCHDGVMAGQVDLGLSRSPATMSHQRVASGEDLGRSHPVGVMLRPARFAGSGSMAMRQPETIDRRIRLFNGRQRTVGCGSCHSAYSHERKMLVMPNLRSALCLSCHHD
jgi:predicted CXXCH cytochrome family protein